MRGSAPRPRPPASVPARTPPPPCKRATRPRPSGAPSRPRPGGSWALRALTRPEPEPAVGEAAARPVPAASGVDGGAWREEEGEGETLGGRGGPAGHGDPPVTAGATSRGPGQLSTRRGQRTREH